jgi:hypothetical protein
MATDLHVDPTVDRLEVVDSVRTRLADLADGTTLDTLIGSALDELTPATVTTYLPILVERRVRDRIRTESPPA